MALLRNNTLVAVAGYEEPRPKLLPPLPTAAVQAWTIIPPSQTLSHTIECLVSIEQTIFVVDASEAEDRLLTTGPFDYVAVSPNGKFVALHTADGGRVWVITSDFQHKLSEYETKTRTRPRDMQWCGNDAVILAWEDEIRILGPNGASTTSVLPSPVLPLPVQLSLTHAETSFLPDAPTTAGSSLSEISTESRC